MIRTHAQSNSNAGLSLACKAGKTQSYFSNQNGDMVTMVTRARIRPTRGRALTPGCALSSGKHFGVLTDATVRHGRIKTLYTIIHSQILMHLWGLPICVTIKSDYVFSVNRQLFCVHILLNVIVRIE